MENDVATLNISNKLSTDTVFFQPLISDISVGRIKIPKFQRPYVWKEQQALKLLDSVFRSYPIGSLLIWRTSSKLKTARAFGEFVLPETPDLFPTDYVLDGRQRLTVIYSCLTTDTTVTSFDVVFDLESEVFSHASKVSPGITIFPLRKLFATTDLLNFRTALQAHTNAANLQARLDELLTAFTQYKLPVVYLKDLQLSEVCPIFERVNSSGTKLSTYDLMVAATWSDNFDLDDCIDKIATSLGPKGFEDIDRITVVKCMSALHTGSIKDDAIDRLRELSPAGLDKLTADTEAALFLAVDSLTTEFGVYSWDFLTYEALVVIMCALFAKKKLLAPIEHVRLKQWFWRSSWSERYKAGGETFVSKDIEVVTNFVFANAVAPAFFGEPPTPSEWKRILFRLNASRSRALALALAKANPRSLLNGTVIDVEEALSIFNRKQFHHVYPQAHLKKAKVPDDNLLLNICLLPASANNKISDQDPRVYIPNIVSSLGTHADLVFASNLLPAPGQFPYATATYEQFIDARLGLMQAMVEKLCEGVA
jgi:hypothetical protein